MSPSNLLHSLTLTDVCGCYHISYVTSDRAWVSDYENNLILTNTIPSTLKHVRDLSGFFIDNGHGKHTINGQTELIYIDKKLNIKKLSKDMKTTTTLIERPVSRWTWVPKCVYWSPSTGDLLVGMIYVQTEAR